MPSIVPPISWLTRRCSTDITDLIGENIRFLESKAQEMLDCLQDGMTFDEWF